jgi:predicted DNA-binding protein (MmcQ/YjbR family)
LHEKISSVHVLALLRAPILNTETLKQLQDDYKITYHVHSQHWINGASAEEVQQGELRLPCCWCCVLP